MVDSPQDLVCIVLFVLVLKLAISQKACLLHFYYSKSMFKEKP